MSGSCPLSSTLGCVPPACWVIVRKEWPSYWEAYGWLMHVRIKCKCTRKVTGRVIITIVQPRTNLPFKSIIDDSSHSPCLLKTHTRGTPTTDGHCGCQCSPVCVCQHLQALLPWHLRRAIGEGRTATMSTYLANNPPPRKGHWSLWSWVLEGFWSTALRPRPALGQNTLTCALVWKEAPPASWDSE